jgi:quercetin dioxygenase-like cupin family protein
MKRENPTIEICPGIARRTVASGKTMYQMIATLTAGSRMPAHSHLQEQIVHILEGRMRLIVEGVPVRPNQRTVSTEGPASLRLDRPR